MNLTLDKDVISLNTDCDQGPCPENCEVTAYRGHTVGITDVSKQSVTVSWYGDGCVLNMSTNEFIVDTEFLLVYS